MNSFTVCVLLFSVFGQPMNEFSQCLFSVNFLCKVYCSWMILKRCSAESTCVLTHVLMICVGYHIQFRVNLELPTSPVCFKVT